MDFFGCLGFFSHACFQLKSSSVFMIKTRVWSIVWIAEIIMKCKSTASNDPTSTFRLSEILHAVIENNVFLIFPSWSSERCDYLHPLYHCWRCHCGIFTFKNNHIYNIRRLKITWHRSRNGGTDWQINEWTDRPTDGLTNRRTDGKTDTTSSKDG